MGFGASSATLVKGSASSEPERRLPPIKRIVVPMGSSTTGCDDGLGSDSGKHPCTLVSVSNFAGLMVGTSSSGAESVRRSSTTIGEEGCTFGGSAFKLTIDGG